MPGLNTATIGTARPRVNNAPNGLVTFDLQEPVSSLDWSPDGKYVVVAGTEGSLAIVDAANGRLRRKLSGHKSAMRAAWSPNGLWIVSEGQDGKIKLWHFQSGELFRELEGGAAWVEHVTWSRDGSVLATGAGKSLRLWNVAGERYLEFAGHESTITALQWRGDGKGLATACYGKVRCFRLGVARPYETLPWKSSLISMAWSPAGRFIATGTQENSIQFFRLGSGGEPPLEMSGYPGKVRHLAWDRKSRLLATNSRDFVIVWDVSGKGPARFLCNWRRTRPPSQAWLINNAATCSLPVVRPALSSFGIPRPVLGPRANQPQRISICVSCDCPRRSTNFAGRPTRVPWPSVARTEPLQSLRRETQIHEQHRIHECNDTDQIVAASPPPHDAARRRADRCAGGLAISWPDQQPNPGARNTG